MDIPSYQVSKGEVISTNSKPAFENTKDHKLPEWLERSGENFVINSLPESVNINSDLNSQVVVEFYSR